MLLDHPHVGPDFVHLALTAGRMELAAEVVAQIEEAAARLDTVTARGVALRCRSLLVNDASLLARAVEELRHGPRPLDYALACEDAGVALLMRAAVAEARELLDEASAVYENLGAARGLARVNAALRAAGVRRGRRGARQRRPASGWDSLTKTENAVVELVRQGLTNAEVGERLFISPRTVECHLSHVFGKLGLASRSALRDEAARRVEARARYDADPVRRAAGSPY